MRFTLKLTYPTFSVSVEAPAQVKYLKSCYCQRRIGEYSQWSLEGDSVVQRQVPRAILHSQSYPI